DTRGLASDFEGIKFLSEQHYLLVGAFLWRRCSERGRGAFRRLRACSRLSQPLGGAELSASNVTTKSALLLRLFLSLCRSA
ncbi:hypothetical protein, partial [Xanthomonas bromi]|uniref:hypothetical protein n=1 Tax=Xanthomonas bromi TaxID=56449 RepID=UPI001CA4C789